MEHCLYYQTQQMYWLVLLNCLKFFCCCCNRLLSGSEEGRDIFVNEGDVKPKDGIIIYVGGKIIFIFYFALFFDSALLLFTNISPGWSSERL